MKGSVDATTITMVVPSVALRWIVYNNTETNTDLAILSNVAFAWREVVVDCLVDLLVNTKPTPPPAALSRLLVPSWMRQFGASSGAIQEKGTSTRNEQDTTAADTYCVAWFHPDGIRSKYLTTAPKNPSPKAAVVETRVLYQWDGFSEAIDVLGPFGYTNSFLRNVVQKTQNRFVSASSGSDSISIDSNDHREHNVESPIAVREVISARPEGYPTAYDEHDADQVLGQNDEVLTIQKPLRKQELERLVLPKVLLSNQKVPLPFVQFLNCDSNHAIRLLTPKFESPVFTPLTVFCVAIATEDGCFFSGLEEELAMGHMYPTTLNEAICIDRSPVCLSANYRERVTTPPKERSETGAPDNEHGLPDHTRDAYLGHDCGVLKPSITEDSESDSESGNESSAEGATMAMSGQLGPGSWHCYTGIFDGNQSIIRIDGEEESMSCASTIPSTFRACLDGITIGSDTSFDMSLCFGQGSDGEGEGAIAEVAFFKGRLHTNDIALLESHLMKKHGIPFPVTPRNDRIREDVSSRLAHKLMDQSAARARRNKNLSVSVPLRYLTELRHVAWKQRDPVTGQRRAIKVIGGKRLHTGSTTSD